MIVFRCVHCSRINISNEGYICKHCGREESRVSTIPKNQSEQRSPLTKGDDALLHKQNKSTEASLPKASEKLSVPSLQKDDERDNYIETMNANRSHISLPQEKPGRSLAQKIPSSRNQSTRSKTFYSRYCTSTKSDISTPTMPLQSTSEQQSCHMFKNNLPQKKAFKHNKTTKTRKIGNTVKQLNLENSCNFSGLDSSVKNSDNVNRFKNNQDETDVSSVSLSIKRKKPSVNNSQEDLNITNVIPEHSTCPPEVSLNGCNIKDLGEKIPIKRITIPVLQKLFICNKCGKNFTTEEKLKVHFLHHFKEKPFKCDKCNSKYFSEAHLKRHYSSHENKGPFKCDVCDLVYARRCHLSRHRKKHVLESALDDSIDQQVAVPSSQQLEEEANDDDNSQKHSQNLEEDIFLCSHCGVKFIHESDFIAHCQRHSEKNPFKCNKCNKKFRYEIYLNRHYCVHTLKRPFTCNVCGFKSTQSSNLKKHLKIHA